MGADLTIGRWVRDRGRITGDRTAILFDGDPTTYGELDQRSGRLAGGPARRRHRAG